MLAVELLTSFFLGVSQCEYGTPCHTSKRFPIRKLQQLNGLYDCTELIQMSGGGVPWCKCLNRF